MSRLSSALLALACIVAPVASIVGAAHLEIVADAVYACDAHGTPVYCEKAAEHPVLAAWFRR